MVTDISQLPLVSFIIPTLNAAPMLPKCLRAIRGQKYPQKKVEIIISDGGSSDKTREIALKFGSTIIHNPDILHEPGKSRGMRIAKGEVFFFTDADNVLAHKNWLKQMVKPYLDNPKIMGFLPQTIPAPDSNSLDKYLGYLCTDPFTWYIYKNASSGRDLKKIYSPIVENKNYQLYQFLLPDPPMFGLSQGVGVNRKFKRGELGYADDILAGIQLIKDKGLIVYVPTAFVYHYHVSGLNNFYKKYQWRTRNNWQQNIKGMGMINRLMYFSMKRKIKIYLYLPYAFSILLPVFDSLFLSLKYKDPVMLWHAPASILIAFIIISEKIKLWLLKNLSLGRYE